MYKHRQSESTFLKHYFFVKPNDTLAQGRAAYNAFMAQKALTKETNCQRSKPRDILLACICGRDDIALAMRNGTGDYYYSTKYNRMIHRKLAVEPPSTHAPN
jgi:hypothetical protein